MEDYNGREVIDMWDFFKYLAITAYRRLLNK